MGLDDRFSAACRANPDCDRRFDEMERRLGHIESTHSAKWDAISLSITELKVSVGNLNGRLAGYLLAASLLGVVVAFIAQAVLRGGA
jgi:hypothetical protein